MKRAKLLLILLISFPLFGGDTHKKDTLTIITYNLWMLPFQKLARNAVMVASWFGISSENIERLDTKAKERSKIIPEKLAGLADVYVFQEGFDGEGRKKFIKRMKKAGVPYSKKVLKRKGIIEAVTSKRLTHSGLFAMSHYPIVKAEGIFFQDSFKGSKGVPVAGSNKMADKGVYYIKIIKGGKPYHIFFTHTEAGGRTAEEKKQGVELKSGEISTGGKHRLEQFNRIKAFIDHLKISKNEPVIIAGDFNSDKAAPQKRPDRYQEYQELQKRLNVTEVPKHPKSINYTVPRSAKAVAKGVIRPWIDYILYSNKHLKPSKAWVKVQDQFEGEGGKPYYSDHLPLLGYFEFQFSKTGSPALPAIKTRFKSVLSLVASKYSSFFSKSEREQTQ